MVSSSLSKNIYANKISANKIDANQIKANKIIGNSPSKSPSYLFSMDINEASYDSNSGILSFSKNSVIDIIQFSDRPLRYSKDITIEEFDNLFSEGISDNFTEYKPNLVLYLPDSGQNSFELTKFEVKNGTINYTLKNIGTQTINIPSFNNQRISLFVDNLTTTTTQISTLLTNIFDNINTDNYPVVTVNGYSNIKLEIEFEDLTNTSLLVDDDDKLQKISNYVGPTDSPFNFQITQNIESFENLISFAYKKNNSTIVIFLSTKGDFYSTATYSNNNEKINNLITSAKLTILYISDNENPKTITII